MKVDDSARVMKPTEDTNYKSANLPVGEPLMTLTIIWLPAERQDPLAVAKQLVMKPAICDRRNPCKISKDHGKGILQGPPGDAEIMLSDTIQELGGSVMKLFASWTDRLLGRINLIPCLGIPRWESTNLFVLALLHSIVCVNSLHFAMICCTKVLVENMSLHRVE